MVSGSALILREIWINWNQFLDKNLTTKNKILIIGGTGFIGYHLAKRSLKEGWKVTSVSTRKPKKLRYISKVKYLICDITKKRSLKNKIKTNYNLVVNVGGYVAHSNKKRLATWFVCGRIIYWSTKLCRKDAMYTLYFYRQIILLFCVTYSFFEGYTFQIGWSCGQ